MVDAIISRQQKYDCHEVPGSIRAQTFLFSFFLLITPCVYPFIILAICLFFLFNVYRVIFECLFCTKMVDKFHELIEFPFNEPIE